MKGNEVKVKQGEIINNMNKNLANVDGAVERIMKIKKSIRYRLGFATYRERKEAIFYDAVNQEFLSKKQFERQIPSLPVKTNYDDIVYASAVYEMLNIDDSLLSEQAVSDKLTAGLPMIKVIEGIIAKQVVADENNFIMLDCSKLRNTMADWVNKEITVGKLPQIKTRVTAKEIQEIIESQYFECVLDRALNKVGLSVANAEEQERKNADFDASMESKNFKNYKVIKIWAEEVKSASLNV